MASVPQQPVQQATAIPYRWQGEGVEFCLITSMQKRHWAFPKGVIDPGETTTETALKEAYEEAGLVGAIVSDPLGTYDYAKWDRQLTVTVLLMQVTEAEDEWEESDLRQRRWASPEEALRLVARDELRRLLSVALQRLGVPEAA